jgi:hypothetical protein
MATIILYPGYMSIGLVFLLADVSWGVSFDLFFHRSTEWKSHWEGLLSEHDMNVSKQSDGWKTLSTMDAEIKYPIEPNVPEAKTRQVSSAESIPVPAALNNGAADSNKIIEATSDAKLDFVHLGGVTNEIYQAVQEGRRDFNHVRVLIGHGKSQ